MHHLQARNRWVPLLLLTLALVGLPLHSAFGERFLSEYALPSAVLAPALILPGLLVLSMERFRAALRTRIPTAWVRWMAYPVFVLLIAALLSLAGGGWVAAISRLLANEVVTVELTVLGVSRYETRRTLCLQRVEVKYGKKQVSHFCADELLVRGQVSAGRRLLGTGIASPLGVHLHALRLPSD